MSDGLDGLRRDVALGCRVMAHRGLVENILGHISVRIEGGRALVRSRGPRERGLQFTVPDDVRVVDLDTGEIADDPAGDYAVPSELPIHTSVLAAHPDVECVVHAHPPDVVVASLAGFALEPIFGAYDIPAAHLAAAGIPVHPRSVLIRTDELAAEMVASLGDASALVLQGHGVVTTGAEVADAVLRALQVDTLARMHLRVRAAGATPEAIPENDLAELPDLGSAFNRETLWRHHLAALEQDGRGLS
ncbi:MAG: class II aldolase/adducin family protein [Acidimicrobiales bacterium]|uniref:class II aldolase/adducin family protein n=1 Tax=Candidatus Poriferisodalis multihospitum TaxID=2983191 RepID=UPI00138225EA|nr:class II aldolase/adducin family protein [Candidatus Poriferisodalis multihospitum]MXV87033.1 class II aldolase/adducin family protein [Acidimicrobiales bacterium]MYB81599.1 class II aldolase/adducin family protein [Acidimicrobiales bacterium]MYI13086.1 class II aldolase/adducin family protein [Acidimicrobiales bacterium]